MKICGCEVYGDSCYTCNSKSCGLCIQCKRLTKVYLDSIKKVKDALRKL